MSLRILFFIFAIGTIFHCKGDVSPDVARVRNLISAVLNDLPKGGLGTEDYIMEFGFHYRANPSYFKMAEEVSNSFDVIFSNIDLYATNGLERLMLLSAGWAFDDDYYLRCYSNNVELAVQGRISAEELRWFNGGSCNEHRMNALALYFDKPGISNVVRRLASFTGDTNTAARILSGEAKRKYVNYTNEISILSKDYER